MTEDQAAGAPARRRLRIVFDPQGALGGSRQRGIGRYTRSFLREFVIAAQHHEIFILLNTMLPGEFETLRGDLAGLVRPENFVTWSAEPGVGGMFPQNNQRRAFAEEMWEEAVTALEPDLLLVSSLFEGAEDDAVSTIPEDRDYLTATICYDLIPLIYSNFYLPDPHMRVFYQRQLEALKRSDFLLAISQSAADEAVQILRYPVDRVKNIGAAVDSHFGAVMPLDLAARFGIERPYLLYVSAFEVRKNHAGLIRAYARLPQAVRQTHQLVLGGGVGAVEALRELGSECGLADDELVFTGKVDDGELAALYAQAKAVAFPSWHEGFGLPILEAMMFGKAVISSNRSSMPEVVGCDDALFDPFDPDETARIVERVLTDDAFRQQLERNAPERIAAFTWERSARLALEFLEEGIARHPRPRNRLRRHAAAAIRRLRANPQLEDLSGQIAASHIARTFRRDERRQLLIDVSRLVVHDARTGIQRVVRAILMNLLRHPPEGFVVEPVHANANEQGYRYARRFADQFLGTTHPWHDDAPVEVWSGDVFCILDLEPDVLVHQREVLVDWRVRGVEIYTVVHDILPVLLPEYFPPSVGRDVLARWVRELVRYDGAICVSQTVAGQLQAWVESEGIETSPRFRYDWFHHGSDLASSAPTKGLPDDAADVLGLMAARPAVLMVGTLEPRKGHAQAIRAFDLLWSRGTDIALVIVGKEGWRVSALAEQIRSHPEYERRLFWLEAISDEYLGKLYAAATVLLGASEGEGFGLPLIEAARQGLPLLVRDLPVFREVAGEGAAYFENSREPATIADAIGAWLIAAREGRHPRPEAVRWLTWRQSAQMLVDRLLDHPQSPSTLGQSVD